MDSSESITSASAISSHTRPSLQEPWGKGRLDTRSEPPLPLPTRILSQEEGTRHTQSAPTGKTQVKITLPKETDNSLSSPLDQWSPVRGDTQQDIVRGDQPPRTIWNLPSVIGSARKNTGTSSSSSLSVGAAESNVNEGSNSSTSRMGGLPSPTSLPPPITDRLDITFDLHHDSTRSLNLPLDPPPFPISSSSTDFTFDPWGTDSISASTSKLLSSHSSNLPLASTSTDAPVSTATPAFTFAQQQHIWSRSQQEQALALQQRQERQLLQLSLQQQEERYQQRHYHDWQHYDPIQQRRDSAPSMSILHAPQASSPALATTLTRPAFSQPYTTTSQQPQYRLSNEDASRLAFEGGAFSGSNNNRGERSFEGGPSPGSYAASLPTEYFPQQRRSSTSLLPGAGANAGAAASLYRRTSQEEDLRQQQQQHQQLFSTSPNNLASRSTLPPTLHHAPYDLAHFRSPPYTSAPVSRSHTSDRLHHPSPYPLDLSSLSLQSPPIALGGGGNHGMMIHQFPPSTTRRRPQRRGDPLRSGLPLVPAHSPYAMWAGNVPADATHTELWKFFTERSPPPAKTPGGDDEPGSREGEPGMNRAGVESIHLITRSNCSFINYITERHLLHAIRVSNGVSLRPHDRRCKALLCRVRAQEDDAKSGVGAQRGTGMHRYFLAAKELEKNRMLGRPDGMGLIPGGSTGLTGGGEEAEDGESGSTSSSLLEMTFPKRYFILKSHNEEDLQSSVASGLWATQSHNEPILDQAFRTAKEGVYIIFSVNKSGEWYGYARMTSQVPSMHLETDPAISPTASSQPTSTSPTTVAPSPFSPSDRVDTSTASATEISLSDRDDLSPGTEGMPDESEALGTPFRLEWIKVQRLPFARTRTIANSFNMNREVKISRDGTEIEPLAGERLLREFWNQDPTTSSSLLSSNSPVYLPKNLASMGGGPSMMTRPGMVLRTSSGSGSGSNALGMQMGW